MGKHKSLNRLRNILSELFDARYRGVEVKHIYRAQGLADGYMRALADLKVVDETELLALTNEERHRAARRAEKNIASSLTPKTAPNPV